MEAKVGVYTAAEVNGPSVMPEPKFFDMSSPATWSLIWFLLAVTFLFIL